MDGDGMAQSMEAQLFARNPHPLAILLDQVPVGATLERGAPIGEKEVGRVALGPVDIQESVEDFSFYGTDSLTFVACIQHATRSYYAFRPAMGKT
jgi:hypothetical protein